MSRKLENSWDGTIFIGAVMITMSIQSSNTCLSMGANRG